MGELKPEPSMPFFFPPNYKNYVQTIKVINVVTKIKSDLNLTVVHVSILSYLGKLKMSEIIYSAENIACVGVIGSARKGTIGQSILILD